MKYKIYHLAPFDIGYAFSDYKHHQNLQKKAFINSLLKKCNSIGISLNTDPPSPFLCVASLNDKISCYFLESGIGVFLIHGNFPIDYSSLDSFFSSTPACSIYYRKKLEQQLILNADDRFPQIKVIHSFMQIVWDCVPHKIRPFSATAAYKHHGLSYVLSVYHLFENALSVSYATSWNLLMNPSIMSSILDNDSWTGILDKAHNYQSQPVNASSFSESTEVHSSWSAVAVIEDTESLIVEQIIKYEILLQSSWFLYDCLMDNINHTQLSYVDLHIYKSLASSISLEISIITGANLSTNEMITYSHIYSTSGADVLFKKLSLLLDNRISIADANIQRKQSVYGIITEILLVLFTLISLYDPVTNLINNEITNQDLYIGGVMLLILLISSIFIIGKERHQ